MQYCNASTLLLQKENNELRARHNQYKKCWDAGRNYIQNDAEEAQRRIQEGSQRYISIAEEEYRPRKRAVPVCIYCSVQGHTRVSCNSK